MVRKMKIMILMSTYNGEKYLEEQIESILGQEKCEISILVRDDSSSDGTRKILEEYSQQGKLKWYTGNNLGCAKSFWHLIINCEEADYYAFCDQDDVWDSDKIKTAIDFLRLENNDIPLLYCSDVRTTDEKLNVICENMCEKGSIDYPHSLIRNISPGCTYVFNNRLRKLVKKYNCDKLGIDIHDWTVYKIAACFGKVIFDEKAHMCYRQHGNNVIGAVSKGIFYWVNSLKHFILGKNDKVRSINACRLEKCYGEYMSEKNRKLTYIVAHYMENIKTKYYFLKCPDFKIEGFKNICFNILILLNKV